jgi:serine/threonine-protein kinase HipA
MKQLFVYYNQDLVGVLIQNEDATYSFEYEKTWAQKSYSFSLSPSLPVSNNESFGHRESLSYFENLIPEGEVKKRLEKLLGKSLDGGLGFLEEFGIDCAGALIISPKRLKAEQLDSNIEPEFVEIDLNRASEDFKNNKNLMKETIETYGGHFSLAGAQDKIPVIRLKEGVFISTNSFPSLHIIKPPHHSKSVKDSVYNEYFCMKLAKACGLDVPEVDVIENEVPFYVIERFDRKYTDDGVQRIHQIDFCQAQGKLVSEKYEAEGGPSLKDCYMTIKSHSSKFIEDTKKFTSWIAFNLIIGNNDSHSKNISFIVDKKSMYLSPFYDLLCTSVYKEYNPRFAFKISGRDSWDKMTSEHFVSEVDSWGLPRNNKILKNAVFDTACKVEKEISGLVETFNSKFPNVKLANRLKVEVLKRAQSFKKRLET